MNKAATLIFKGLLTLCLGVFFVPTIGFGCYLAACWLRIHFSNVYYADYPYAAVVLSFLFLGFLCLSATLYGALKRSFWGLLIIVPILIGLAAMVAIPNLFPHGYSGVADTNYLSSVHAFFRVWYEDHHKFPATETEFREAMARGPAAWPAGLPPIPASEYKLRGVSLPYEIVVTTDARGARLEGLSSRPGVIYYCVSPDLQEFWVTMTSLPSDVSPTAVVRHIADLPFEPVELIHSAGRDYPVKKP